MSRLRLGVDLDGCVYDWQGCYRFIARECLGVEMPPVEEFWTSVGAERSYLTEPQRKWMWEGGIERGLFRYGNLVKGAAEALQKLSEVFDLVVVSHRPNPLEFDLSPQARRTAILDTLSWLSYLRLPFSEIHMLRHDQPKSSVRCDLYIDDSPSVVAELSRTFGAAGPSILLLDRPWNRSSFEPGVTRVYDWRQVLEVVWARY